jgi:transcriptional regulator with XRE-family HTH domain
VDDLAVGRLIMLARQRRQWRQLDLASAAGVSRGLVALAEAGSLERMTLRSLRRIAASLEIRLPFQPIWNGGQADRLRDRDHAQLVEAVTRVLRTCRWELIIEYTFSHFGERGSVDLVAWHPQATVMLVVEVKTRIYDVQRLIAGVDRKARLVGRLLRDERGWVATDVARLVVVPELTANRSLVAAHAALFDVALPARSREVRTWLHKPAGSLRGVWFLSSSNTIGGIQVQVGRQRVRVPRHARSARVDSPSANVVGN